VTIKYYESPFHASETTEVAELYVIKSLFCGAIRDKIKINGWTQQQASEVLNVTQPKISNIINGKVDKISIDKLVTILINLGFEFAPKRNKRSPTVNLQFKPIDSGESRRIASAA